MKINIDVLDFPNEDSVVDDIIGTSTKGVLVDRPAERTCSLCGEPLTTRPELNLGICDVCRHDREDLDTETYLPVDVYMGTRGEYEITPQKSTSFEDDEFDGFHEFSEDEDDLPSM